VLDLLDSACQLLSIALQSLPLTGDVCLFGCNDVVISLAEAKHAHHALPLLAEFDQGWIDALQIAS